MEYVYDAEIVRWVDGDTVYLKIDKTSRLTRNGIDLDLGFHCELGPQYIIENIRITHIDGRYFDTYEKTLRGGTTPEQKELGLEALRYAERILPPGTKVFIRTKKDDTGARGRYLASIRHETIGEYAQHMTDKGYTTQTNK